MGSDKTVAACNRERRICCCNLTVSIFNYNYVSVADIIGGNFFYFLTMTCVIITDVINSRERGVALAFNSVAIGITVVLFPTISAYIPSLSGWSAMTWVGIGLMLLALSLTILLREAGIGNWDHSKKKSTYTRT